MSITVQDVRSIGKLVTATFYTLNPQPENLVSSKNKTGMVLAFPVSIQAIQAGCGGTKAKACAQNPPPELMGNHVGCRYA